MINNKTDEAIKELFLILFVDIRFGCKNQWKVVILFDYFITNVIK